MNLSTELKELFDQYLQEEPDALLRFEIKELLLQENEAELKERLGQNLKFGTAGVRARMQAGYNRMNHASVYRFAYALGTALDHNKTKKAVLGFDGRQNGYAFAHEIKKVLFLMGFEISYFEEPVPTPLCAFATKYEGADIGIMVTASHNPGYDNGIKLYDSEAAQICGKLLERIEEGMKHAPLRPSFYNNDFNVTIDNAKSLGVGIEEAYCESIQDNRLFSHSEICHDLNIAYTALHGVGQKLFLKNLKEEAFDNISYVSSQAKPDGAFPTLIFPNPEEEHALDRVIDLAIEKKCDYVVANDPDADRVQVCYRDDDGNFYKLSGNEMGVLLGYFAIEKSLNCGQKPLVASSIVSSRMLEAMAIKMGALYADGLTGFSNIAHAAKEREKNTQSNFVFAYEEAIGFLVGKTILDKDGINAGNRFIEILGWLKKKEISLFEFMDQLSLRFGIFLNSQWSVRYEGLLANNEMEKVLERIRRAKISDLENMINVKDIEKWDLKSIEKGPYVGIYANIVIFEIKGSFRFIIRPSGTEPKIKFYLEVMDKADNLIELKDKKKDLGHKLKEYRRILEKLII